MKLQERRRMLEREYCELSKRLEDLHAPLRTEPTIEQLFCDAQEEEARTRRRLVQIGRALEGIDRAQTVRGAFRPGGIWP